jgi:hypothetical protein
MSMISALKTMVPVSIGTVAQIVRRAPLQEVR